MIDDWVSGNGSDAGQHLFQKVVSFCVTTQPVLGVYLTLHRLSAMMVFAALKSTDHARNHLSFMTPIWNRSDASRGADAVSFTRCS